MSEESTPTIREFMRQLTQKYYTDTLLVDCQRILATQGIAGIYSAKELAFGFSLLADMQDAVEKEVEDTKEVVYGKKLAEASSK